MEVTVGLICLLGRGRIVTLPLLLLHALHHQVPPAHRTVGVGLVVGEHADPPGDVRHGGGVAPGEDGRAVTGPVTDLATLELGGGEEELVTRTHQLVLGRLHTSDNRSGQVRSGQQTRLSLRSEVQMLLTPKAN